MFLLGNNSLNYCSLKMHKKQTEYTVDWEILGFTIFSLR